MDIITVLLKNYFSDLSEFSESYTEWCIRKQLLCTQWKTLEKASVCFIFSSYSSNLKNCPYQGGSSFFSNFTIKKLGRSMNEKKMWLWHLRTMIWLQIQGFNWSNPSCFLLFPSCLCRLLLHFHHNATYLFNTL